MKIHTGVDTRGGGSGASPPRRGGIPRDERKDKSDHAVSDFYELTMGNGYFQTGLGDRICYFDVFFRSVPDQGGFLL